MNDLFETPDIENPANVMVILESYNQEEQPYKDIDRILKLLKPLGYISGAMNFVENLTILNKYNLLI